MTETSGSLAPKADGTIPQAQVRVLREIGDWLRINGEAIYNTRPWRIQAEGDVSKVWSGKLGTGWRFDDCDASDIRFTCKGNTLYAIALGWPGALSRGGSARGDDKLSISSLRERTHLGTVGVRTIRLLGCEQRLSWTRDGQGLHIDLPPEKPHEHAYAFKIEVDGELEA
jgi:alpha-L-fucosidase